MMLSYQCFFKARAVLIFDIKNKVAFSATCGGINDTTLMVERATFYFTLT